MHPAALSDLAARIMARANAGKVVRLTPETALIVAQVLSARASRPMRHRIIAAMCNVPHCKDRRDCVECIMKANAVEQLYRDEYWAVTQGRASE